MRLSNLADYGVVVMTAAARSAAEGRLTSAAQVALLTGIPAPTVAKLMGQLGRAGLLSSQRGVAGGFTLARAPAEISLADIVESIDGPISLTHCGQPGADCCGLSTSCQVKPHWAPVNRAVRDALSGVSLAVLAQESLPETLKVPA
ncbi:SUF system Fe-S cluster assembly regulator [Sandaracinobacter sp. RS1-74]|nr:SUF system Fe-S cluster assembly regulator [Sandaracinobacteroides sayramensis]MCG2840743.1 SUF system Fe-S cluster assembly regulator [Sandaracinobacteroides sayramensis]